MIMKKYVNKVIVCLVVTLAFGPFPRRAISTLSSVIPVWIACLLATIPGWRMVRRIDELRLRNRLLLKLPESAIIVAVSLSVLAGLIAAVIIIVYSNMELDAFALCVITVIPLNLAGPPYTALRYWDGKGLLIGELLWAWLGLVWSLLLANWKSHNLVEQLCLAAELTRLTIAVTVVLTLYGRRPMPGSDVTAHRLGWVLLSFDVILLGWYAKVFL